LHEQRHVQLGSEELVGARAVDDRANAPKVVVGEVLAEDRRELCIGDNLRHFHLLKVGKLRL